MIQVIRMSLNFGRHQLAIPGPSVIPERVLAAMHRASPNIYEGEIVEMTESLPPDLRAVARTQHKLAIYIANGHGAWEAALRNTVRPGEKILVLATGRFAANWGKLAETLDISVEKLDFGMQGHAEPEALEKALRRDSAREIKAVLTVQTDTASSVRNDIRELRAAIDASGHPALFLVDCIASMGCEPFEMDQWGVDVAVTACQKGLMTPAGLSFVFFNDKAAAARKATRPGYYWDWIPRADPHIYYEYFGGTPPTHLLFALRTALDMLVHEEGVEEAWARHETIAKALWDAIDVWGEGGTIRHNIQDRRWRSTAVSTIETASDEASRIRGWCESQGGITLGIGVGFGDFGSQEYNRRFRIGHMGYNNLPMVMGVLGAVDAGLKVLGIPHGNGALEAATLVLSKHGRNSGVSFGRAMG
jgi:alanine-glyoxylate transaminase / serine-glyoxylate transaminase / serine-pyruvate transaminase